MASALKFSQLVSCGVGLLVGVFWLFVWWFCAFLFSVEFCSYFSYNQGCTWQNSRLWHWERNSETQKLRRSILLKSQPPTAGVSLHAVMGVRCVVLYTRGGKCQPSRSVWVSHHVIGSWPVEIHNLLPRSNKTPCTSSQRTRQRTTPGLQWIWRQFPFKVMHV